MSTCEPARVELDPGLRRSQGGTVLIGGSPLHVMRLTDEGARLVDRWAAGTPVGTSPRERRLVRRLLDAGLAHPVPAVSPYTVDDVSVVIPVRDRPRQRTQLLDLIGPVGEVLVVDDGSTTPVPGAVARHNSPRGPAAARNTGWRAATRQIVAFIDSDCQPTRDWLDRLLPHFADPQVAAVAPRILGCDGDTLLHRYERHRSPLDLGPQPGRVLPRSRIAYVPTAALLVRRTAVEELNGFDEQLRYGEDVDLVWRLHRAGRTIRYEPRAIVHHPARNSLRDWLAQRFAYGTSAAPLARRHNDEVPPLVSSPTALAAVLLAGLGYPRAAAAVAAVNTALFHRKRRTLRLPAREGLNLAVRGHLAAAHQLATATTRTWWPVAATAAIGSRRIRRAILAAATVPYLLDWLHRRPQLDPLRWVALRIGDDVAYGAGVWTGCIQTRTIRPLRPDVTSR
jgi:mycofactocin system glycosyltransferase